MKLQAGKVFSFLILSAGMMLLAANVAISQTLSGQNLIAALQKGGFVILMRHASSPNERPTDEIANEDNPNKERQLDTKGRNDAKTMGEAWRRYSIVVTEVMSSPTYRAVETARMAGFSLEEMTRHPGLGGANMRITNMTKNEWTQSIVAQAPTVGNKLIVTHGGNISAAYPEIKPDVAEGEALVFKPDAKGGAELVGRIKISEWASL